MPAAVGVKHTNPCGVACSDNIYDAYIKAYAADSFDFGGIVALNRPVDVKTAKELVKIFLKLSLHRVTEPETRNIKDKEKPEGFGSGHSREVSFWFRYEKSFRRSNDSRAGCERL